MKKIFIFFTLLMFIPTVSAHPGRTDSKGGHTCKTNCSKWGLEQGEYHYHNQEEKTAPTVKEEAKDEARDAAK